MTGSPSAVGKSVTFLDGRVTMHVADVFGALSAMEPESIDCVVTSPPYWGLRDYGVEGQIGLEPTLGEHINTLVRVFAEIHRVLKSTGTVWLNYGDCYATTPNGRSAAGGTLKPKDLCMAPARLALALQDWGWWIRSEIIWDKPNPMPDSSGIQRPSVAHEKIFLLAKSANGDVWRARDTGEISFVPDLAETCPLITDPSRAAMRWMRIGHYYDAEAVRVPQKDSSKARLSQNIDAQTGGARANGGNKTNGNMKAVGKRPNKQRGHSRRHAGLNERWDDMSKEEQRANGHLLRNSEPAHLEKWSIATMPFSEAHFATFPPELAARCILAGCPKGGLVLDPFGGAGTTALAALRHGRRGALIEINPVYADMAQNLRQKVSQSKVNANREVFKSTR